MTLTAQLEEVFRSPGMIACQQRAFMLHAVGIEAEIRDLPDSFVLMVASAQARTAREHIARYQDEDKPLPQPLPLPPALPLAWLAPLLYVASLLCVGYYAGQASFATHWYDIGALTPNVQHSGQWWRIATALTLHADTGHLLSNIGFGALFAFAAARLLGAGVTWLSMVVGASLGNLLDSMLMPQTHVAIGASTQVFAALGLVSAYSWRTQLSLRASRLYSWAHRWGPLVVGVALLGLIGAGGENTDVLAHLTGFFCGALLGAVFARTNTRWFASAALQASAAVTATLIITGAWWWALTQA